SSVRSPICSGSVGGAAAGSIVLRAGGVPDMVVPGRVAGSRSGVPSGWAGPGRSVRVVARPVGHGPGLVVVRVGPVAFGCLDVRGPGEPPPKHSFPLEAKSGPPKHSFPLEAKSAPPKHSFPLEAKSAQ